VKIGEHILPEGWNNWRDPVNEKNSPLCRVQNFGPGTNLESRGEVVEATW